jgi:hypothetical protein
MSGGSSSGPPAALAIQPLRGPLGIAPSQDDPSWAITIIARLALSPSTPARQTACPLRASGVDRSARPSKRACHAHQCRSVGLPLPVNQPVNYAKHDTPIALACALGGSTKLSAGGFVLVSVEVVGCFVVEEPFGLILPCLHELLGLAIVGDGPAQEGGLLGRDHAMHELAPFHVSPFVIRAVTCAGVLGAAASWFAAHFHASQQRA